MWDLITQGSALAADWQVILFLLSGAVLGNLFAAIPGLSAEQAIALFLPFSITMEPLPALSFMIGLYAGGAFGGAIPAILLGIPGSAESAATVLDGHPMAKNGQAGKALKAALWSSVTGNFFAGLTLLFGAALLAPLALKIGPPEYFAIIVFSLTIIAVVSQDAMSKGLFAAGLGLLIAMIGTDPIQGVERFTFGVPELSSGIKLIPLVIGLFSIAELLHQFNLRGVRQRGDRGRMQQQRSQFSIRGPDHRLSWKELRALWPEIGRGSALGIAVGALPGLGAGIAAYVSYALSKKFSKIGKQFGTGVPQGVAATEAANSGTVGSTLLPLVTLGVPGSGTAALFLAAFLLQGIQIGPLAMQQHGPLIYGMFLVFLIAVFVNALAGWGIRTFAPLLLRLPAGYLYSPILAISIVGVFALGLSRFDIFTALFFGVLGYVMRQTGFPQAPLLIGFILGHLAETTLRQSMIILPGGAWGFLQRPIALSLFALALAVAYGFRTKKGTKLVDSQDTSNLD
jgi:putative tricarboxylic transport membrane protein